MVPEFSSPGSIRNTGGIENTEEIWHLLYPLHAASPLYSHAPWPLRPAKAPGKQSREESGEMPEKQRVDPELKKEVAKIAMTASLGVTVLTAPFLKGNHTLKNIHTGAGALFVGTALWHHFLYQSEKKKAGTAGQVSQAAQAPAGPADP